MSHTEKMLRMMTAAPELLEALQEMLPHAEKECCEQAAIALLSCDSRAQARADEWLEVILIAQAAIKKATLAEPKPITLRKPKNQLFQLPRRP